jgi:hypothetical protein
MGRSEVEMSDDFAEAMRNPPPWSNADDPDADRLAARPEAGELGTPQHTHPTPGQDDRMPSPTPHPSGLGGGDGEVIHERPTGGITGLPEAADPEHVDRARIDPGLSGHDQPAEGAPGTADDDLGRLWPTDDLDGASSGR